MAAAKTALTLALLLALAACANGMLYQRSDLERTWDKAVIALPAEGSRPARMGTVEEIDLAGYFASLPRGVRAPVVLYLHGCTGIGNFAFFGTLADAGYVVIAPDSALPPLAVRTRFAHRRLQPFRLRLPASRDRVRARPANPEDS